jgi:DNA-binding CsgD family transcriptional regulator
LQDLKNIARCDLSEHKGIKIGRAKLGFEIRQKIAHRAAKGQTPSAIAKALGIDRRTAAKYVTTSLD